LDFKAKKNSVYKNQIYYEGQKRKLRVKKEHMGGWKRKYLFLETIGLI
jgi:hypothetical protein